MQELINQEFGLCMEGSRASLIRHLLAVMAEAGPFPFRYLEIGVAEGKTLAAMCRSIEAHQRFPYEAHGVDIQDGWSLDAKAARQRVHPYNCEIHLEGSHRFLLRTAINFSFVLVDGCHGMRCVMNDFLLLQNRIVPGGVVAFHDADHGCQGQHLQPHCRTGIAVREALDAFGLYRNEVPGWRFLEQVAAPHGCAFFQYCGV